MLGKVAVAIALSAVFEGARNAEIFRCYIGEMLAPKLLPGDMVVMDDLPAHKGAAIRALIEVRGATLLYLLPYRPDLNPIELMFAKLKYLLGSAAARSIDCLWTTPGDCLRTFTPDECSRYLQHCGYGHSV